MLLHVLGLSVLLTIVAVCWACFAGLVYAWFVSEWELIDKTVLPSAYEQSCDKENEAVALGVSVLNVTRQGIPSWYYRKTVVLTFRDKITGTIKVVKA